MIISLAVFFMVKDILKRLKNMESVLFCPCLALFFEVMVLLEDNNEEKE